MKLLVKDYKKNRVKAKIENLDDLWYLTYIIDKGDPSFAPRIMKQLAQIWLNRGFTSTDFHFSNETEQILPYHLLRHKHHRLPAWE